MRYFDLHCDTLGECTVKNLPLRDNKELQLSLERGRGLSAWFQCFAAWIPDTEPHPLEYFRRVAQRRGKKRNGTRIGCDFAVSPMTFTVLFERKSAAASLR